MSHKATLKGGYNKTNPNNYENGILTGGCKVKDKSNCINTII